MFQSETPSFPKFANDKPVLFSEESTSGLAMGRVQINRPKVLNALNTVCFELLEARLMEWRDDANVAAVMVEGIGEKAFCAGGDVKSLILEVREHGLEAARRFFSLEYFVDYLIHVYPKPVITFNDRITMGGGVGISNGASHRIVTETTVLAMPELAIGFFPDVGATRFLSHVPDGFGLFLGLTGARIGGGDAVRAGLADHFVSSGLKRQIDADLLRLPWKGRGDADRALVSQYFAQIANAPQPADSFSRYLDECRDIFLAHTYEEIYKRFSAHAPRSEFIQDAKARFLSGSALSKQVFFAAYHKHHQLDWREVFLSEWEMALRFSKEDEFKEGVRAVLIDKSGNACWTVKDPEPVANIERFFSSGEKNGLAEKLAKLRY